jgi:hypothetical protein
MRGGDLTLLLVPFSQPPAGSTAILVDELELGRCDWTNSVIGAAANLRVNMAPPSHLSARNHHF